MPMVIPDTPLFVKAHDFLLWLIRHTFRRYPPSYIPAIACAPQFFQ